MPAAKIFVLSFRVYESSWVSGVSSSSFVNDRMMSEVCSAGKLCHWLLKVVIGLALKGWRYHTLEVVLLLMMIGMLALLFLSGSGNWFSHVVAVLMVIGLCPSSDESSWRDWGVGW